MTTRMALYMDVENLVHDLRAVGDYEGAARLVTGLVKKLEERGVVVTKVACCDSSLTRRLAFVMAGAGVRTFSHCGSGPDCADLVLLEQIRNDVPESTNVVVIASGDHIFAEVAQELRSRGKTVVVVALEGSISWQLAKSADEVLVIARQGHELAGTAA